METTPIFSTATAETLPPETTSSPIETTAFLETEAAAVPESTEPVYLDPVPVETVPAETVEMITIEQVQEVANDIIHADLYGSFLVCGTLMGIALFWRLVK